MALFFQSDLENNTRLAVWKIEEEECFFLEKVSLQRSITHPHKRLQHLAGRYLLQYLFPQFPIDLILIADTRKPYLENDTYHFSISHCAQFAAAIVSKEKRVGVDIEVESTKIELIKNKFTSNEELHRMGEMVDHLTPSVEANYLDSNKKLTLLWSCKEAVFKWYGLGGIAFKEDILFEKIVKINNSDILSLISFKKYIPKQLLLHSRFFENVVLTYVVT